MGRAQFTDHDVEDVAMWLLLHTSSDYIWASDGLNSFSGEELM